MKIIIDFMGIHTELTGGFAFMFCAFIGFIVCAFTYTILQLFK